MRFPERRRSARAEAVERRRLASSNSEARRVIVQGGLSINGAGRPIPRPRWAPAEVPAPGRQAALPEGQALVTEAGPVDDRRPRRFGRRSVMTGLLAAVGAGPLTRW